MLGQERPDRRQRVGERERDEHWGVCGLEYSGRDIERMFLAFFFFFFLLRRHA